jgi:mRNA export factor
MYGAPAVAAEADDQLAQGPDDCISSVAWSPKGSAKNLIAATSWDKTIRVWEVQTQVGADGMVGAVATQPVGMFTHTAPILSCAIARDGRVFFGGCCKTAMMWSPATNQTQQVGAHDAPIGTVRWVEDGVPTPMLITAGWDGKVRFWNAQAPTPLKEENLAEPVTDIDVVGPMAAFLTSRKVHIYNLTTMVKTLEQVPPDSCKFQNRKVAIFPNQVATAVCTVDGRVYTNPTQTPGQPPPFQFKAHGGENPHKKLEYDSFQVNFIAVHPTNQTIVSGASDGHVRCFDATTKTRFYESPVKAIGADVIQVCCGSVNQDGSMLAYGLGYDWSLGKGTFNPAHPRGIFIKKLNKSHVR